MEHNKVKLQDWDYVEWEEIPEYEDVYPPALYQSSESFTPSRAPRWTPESMHVGKKEPSIIVEFVFPLIVAGLAGFGYMCWIVIQGVFYLFVLVFQLIGELITAFFENKNRELTIDNEFNDYMNSSSSFRRTCAGSGNITIINNIYNNNKNSKK